MEVQNSTFTEKTIMVLTTLLLASFSVARLNVYGNYLMMVLTLVVVIVYAYGKHGRFPIYIKRLQLSIGLFAFYCCASSLWALNFEYAIQKGITIFEILVCVSIFYWIFNSFTDAVSKMLKVIMWSGYIVSIYTFLTLGFSYLLMVISSGGRLDSAFDNVNMISFVCAVSVIINFYYIIYNKLRIMDIVLMLPTLALIVACGSRKSLLMLVVGILLVYVFKMMGEGLSSKGIKYLFLMGIAVVVFVIAASSSYLAGIMGRMDGLVALFTGSGNVDHSAWLRQQMILLGLSIFKDHPIGGIGIGCPRILTLERFGTNSYLHNNYAELLAGGGAIGFLLYYQSFIYIILFLWKFRKHSNAKETNIIMIIYMCMFLADYGMVSYYSKLHYFLILVGYMCVDKLLKQSISVNS